MFGECLCVVDIISYKAMVCVWGMSVCGRHYKL